MTGSMAESLAYFRGDAKLTATRFSGWDRNDLIHSTSVRRPAPGDEPGGGDVRSKVGPAPRSESSLIKSESAKSVLTAEATWTEGLSDCVLRAMGVDVVE